MHKGRRSQPCGLRFNNLLSLKEKAAGAKGTGGFFCEHYFMKNSQAVLYRIFPAMLQRLGQG